MGIIKWIFYEFFSIDAYSSVWFWALLTIAWLIAIDKTSVLSYSTWLKASKDGELGQKEIMKSFYLKQGKLLNQENNLSLLLLCFFLFDSQLVYHSVFIFCWISSSCVSSLLAFYCLHFLASLSPSVYWGSLWGVLQRCFA